MLRTSIQVLLQVGGLLPIELAICHANGTFWKTDMCAAQALESDLENA